MIEKEIMNGIYMIIRNNRVDLIGKTPGAIIELANNRETYQQIADELSISLRQQIFEAKAKHEIERFEVDIDENGIPVITVNDPAMIENKNLFREVIQKDLDFYNSPFIIVQNNSHYPSDQPK